MPSNLPAQTTPVFATDEDIAVRAGGDYVTLTPAWQCMAQGNDGVFAANVPWVLTSASVNFANNGVKPNQVVSLTAGTPIGSFRGGGQLLAVDSVATNTITLRRLHKDLNVGQPPAPAAGLTAVTFTINTLDPQTEEASFDIKRRFGVDETIAYRSSTWVFDLRDLRMAVVLTVLRDRYVAETRTDRGDFPEKAMAMARALESVIDRVQVRWGPTGNSQESSTLFNTRMSR
jgi:hypothetical protein